MPCIYNIPKNKYRPCELCTALYCDERPAEQNTMSATQYEAIQRIQKGEVSTVNELMRGLREVISELNSDSIPVHLNGRRIKILKVELVNDSNYGYCANIRFKYDSPSVSVEEIKKIIKKKKEESK